MELILPNNYTEIDQEEMMYLDGGWNKNTAWSNVKAMLGMQALSAVGRVLWNFMNKNGKATLTYGKMLASTAVTAAKAFWALPWWAKTAGLAAGAAFVYAIGTWSLFG